MIPVNTQAELDKACEQRDPVVHIAVKGRFMISKTIGWLRLTMVAECSVVAWGNSSVVARENSSVEAWENSSVVAWGNSSVEARENSSVVARENSSVVAWENSSVEARENSSVEARENSSVEAWENSSVVAWGHVFVRLWGAFKIKATALVIIAKHGAAKSIEGGRVLDMPRPTTPQGWCDFYGVPVVDGVAVLYKAVTGDFRSGARWNFPYEPGTTPVAPDWDGGREECGGGLHFSPSPVAALQFHPEAKKFVGCPVALADIAVHPDGQYPEKVKARGCCGPVFEVDRKGNPVVPQQNGAAA